MQVQDKGCMEPAENLYHDISKGTWKYVGILIAPSVCMNGRAPNMFAPWVYKYITDGSAGVLENIPEKLTGKTAAIRFYNEVSLRFLYTFLKFPASFSPSNVMQFTLASLSVSLR